MSARICFQWREGKCKRGANCKYAHDETAVQRCHDFTIKKNCTYGKNCKRGHPAPGAVPASPVSTSTPGPSNGATGPSQPPQTPGVTARSQINPFQSWRRLCKLKPPFFPHQMKTFIDNALKFIQEGDVENVQQVIQDLADRHNLVHLAQLLESDFAYDTAPGVLSFVDHVIPFLRIITDKEFRGSIVVESFAGTVYNIIYGAQGTRGIPFFDRVLSHSRTLMGNDPALYMEVFPMIISALRNTIHLNSNALVQEDFKRIARNSIVQANEQNLFVNPELRQLHQDFKIINEQLSLGEKIPSLIPERAPGAPKSFFSSMAGWIAGGRQGIAHANLHPAVQATARLPGDLSELGPRHDNDHSSIGDIRILPTADEIASIESEYLPKIGGDTVHLDRSQRLLDSQFRLLREDSIGGLRESLRQIIENRENLETLQKGRRKRNDGVKRFSSAGVAVLIHENARIEDVHFSSNHGLKIVVSFNQPIPNETATKRREWWSHENILDFNTLVCILNENNEAMFFTVSDRYVSRADMRSRDRELWAQHTNHPLLTLSDDPNRAGIVLTFADAVREKDVDWLYRLASSADVTKNNLIEFPRTLLAAFRPILQGLQKRIKTTQAIPFIDWLAPDPSIAFEQHQSENGRVSVRPPPYAVKPDFYFELSSIFTDPRGRSARLYPTAYEADNSDVQALLENTTLDDGQARSLVKALSREIGLIQGPPGTGKSYIGTKLVKVLLENKHKANLGPIICVCYTNHALDQFLEHLLDIEVKNIIRLGSRSKSERLDPYLLRNLTQAAENTRLERKQIYDLRKSMESLSKEATDYCSTLADPNSEGSFKAYIDLNFPHLSPHLFTHMVDDEGFQVQHGKGNEKPFSAWRRQSQPGYSTRSARDILTICTNPWELNAVERYTVLTYWRQEMVRNAMVGLSEVTERHHRESDQLSTVRKEWDRRTLQGADIIGVTTTSLAMHADVLERIQAKVLFCEEAGEILEAHTITTLIPSIEHMILIGDHEQLRPHISNYDLSIESQKGQAYALDVSLFERLARQPYGDLALTFPIASLNTQRRMHPSVADLIRLRTYPTLQDQIPEYPPIPGMKKRLFWMNHAHPDSQGDAIRLTTSYYNVFEQEMVISLVTHLLHQGCFKEKQIAVLTPYLGQMSKLRRLLSNSFDIIIGSRDQEALDAEAILEEDQTDESREAVDASAGPRTVVRKSSLAAAVRIATVDNFQGEEADVVIISLVRSNKERKCGFLKTSNRINVLLSRAKWGMYIIGNADTARSQSMWSNVIDHMTLNGCLGNALELECDRHKHIPIQVASKDDFTVYAPEGGCSMRCEWRLSCGHACMAKCHSKGLHDFSPCFEPCTKKLSGCDHTCAAKCGQPCPLCMVTIKDVLLKCGHITPEMRCNQFQHLDDYFCRFKMEKEVPGCKHRVNVECGRDVTAKAYRCSARCGQLLPCGHSCKRPCRDCRKASAEPPYTVTVNHGKCIQSCGRDFNTCSHSCEKECHGESPCGFCEKPCEIRCAHSKCKNLCKEPCSPCAEECTLGCEHQKCNMPCGVSCNILPCDQICSRTLPCGHPCPSVCGEKCPPKKFCRECASDEVLDTVVDIIMFETYRNSRDEPIIFLPCGHFYTISTFDGSVKMRDFFEFSDSEGWEVTGKYMQEKSDPEIPKCPNCRSLFTTSTRYNEIVKKAQLQNCIRRFTASSNDRLVSLMNGVEIQQDELESTRDAFKPTELKNFNPRYRGLMKLMRELRKYNHQVLAEEQPYHRVYELTNFACRSHNLTPDVYNPSVVQYRFGIEGAYQEIRAELLRFCDMDIIASRNSTSEELKKILRVQIAGEVRVKPTRCDKLVKACKTRMYQRLEIQSRIAKSKLVTLLLKHMDMYEGKKNPISAEEADKMRKETTEDLEECLDICEMIPSCGVLKGDVEEAIKSFTGGCFYSVVSDREMKEIYAVMAREFGGTGHWYVCPNGHQFTIGECGRAMQLGTCNECGAQIGGQHHQAVAGVRRDAELERRMADIQI
ncbi:hypothetical protein ABW19_dt0208668 [Dactylella cylindrospora]|nr:hypothetical protein ABW19_dt0208668 [Dactylella cylindrospora]